MPQATHSIRNLGMFPWS